MYYMNNSKIRGDTTELECITEFTKLGYTVSIPFGEDSRYDFIVDINNKLYKIQCKSCSEVLDNNEIAAIRFKTVRQSGSRAKNWSRTKYKLCEVDFFATSYKNKCYIIPLNECSNEKTLRLLPTKNGNMKNINFLANYELSNMISLL